MARRRKQDWSPRGPRPHWHPRPGDRVRIYELVDRWPDFFVPAGTLGTMVEFDPPRMIRVLLDVDIPGAEEWMNEVHWYQDLEDEFWDSVLPAPDAGPPPPPRGAGILFRSGREFLLLRRSPDVDDPGFWSIPGGSIEPGEDPLQSALRESTEEMGSVPLHRIRNRSGMEYQTFLAEVEERHAKTWRPVLNREHDRWGWFQKKELPVPAHPALLRTIRIW